MTQEIPWNGLEHVKPHSYGRVSLLGIRSLFKPSQNLTHKLSSGENRPPKTRRDTPPPTSSLPCLVSPFPNPRTTLLPLSYSLQSHRDAHVAIRGAIFQWHPLKPRAEQQRMCTPVCHWIKTIGGFNKWGYPKIE